LCILHSALCISKNYAILYINLSKEAIALKHWRGYLTAIIFAAITWGFVHFAQNHPVMIDMVYPYLTRIYISSMAGWASGTAACIWQVLLLVLITAILASAVLMVILRWNVVQWAGWVLAAVMGVSMITTVSYSLNAYASPMADDIRLDISDYTVSELNDATVFFRDTANEMAKTLPRTPKGKLDMGSFEEVAARAIDGFDALTYDKSISIFASVDAPVKKLSMAGLFTAKGDSGVTVALTGESAVNPNVPDASLPFAMCKELAHRISIYAEADANFAAFLACTNNPDPYYQYAGYLMAYYYCYEAILSIPTSTAKACATNIKKGVSPDMKQDLDQIFDFYGEAKSTANVQASANITASDSEITLISFSSYSDVADLFASWYIQEYIIPVYEEENPVVEFDPLDESQVDLTGIVNAK